MNMTDLVCMHSLLTEVESGSEVVWCSVGCSVVLYCLWAISNHYCISIGYKSLTSWNLSTEVCVSYSLIMTPVCEYLEASVGPNSELCLHALCFLSQTCPVMYIA